MIRPAGPPVGPPRLTQDALVMPDGEELPLHAWLPAGPPRGVILALHGLNDAAGNFMGETAGAFTAAGYAVYAYDQRGFGASTHRGIWPGAASLVADATTAAWLLHARHPGVPLIMLGESMGGGVALLAGSGPQPPPVDGYILLAPSLWGRAYMPALLRGGLWVVRNLVPGYGFTGTVAGIRATDNIEALRRWSRDPLTLKATRVDVAAGVVDLMDAVVAQVPRCCAAPTLVLFGAHDRVVPAEVAQRALRELPRPPPTGPRVAFYAQGWHLLLRDLEGQVVTRDLLAWLADHGAPLPSGADRAARGWLAAQ